MKYLIAAAIFCISAVVAQQVITVTPNYDYPDEKVKVFYIRRALVLRCDLSVTGEYEIEWWKDGLNVKEVPSLSKRYRTTGNEFRVDNTVESDAGFYECVFPIIRQNATIEAIANVDVGLPKDFYVVEGETLKLKCLVVGTNPIISWIVGNESYPASRGRVVLDADDGSIANIRLVISDIVMEDRNEYTCIARNKASDLLGEPQQDTTLVRVRSRYAAVWPFLGICVEVIVLCLVIWVCERHRLRKLREEEEDYEPQGKGKSPR